MKNFIQRVFFPSYKRTISVLVILILVLSVPITLRLVGQQQDLRQRAQEAFHNAVDRNDNNGNSEIYSCDGTNSNTYSSKGYKNGSPFGYSNVDTKKHYQCPSNTVCTKNGIYIDCVPPQISCSGLDQNSCDKSNQKCFWYGGGPGENARCVDNGGNMNSSNICNGGHCYADQNYCVENRCTATAPPACPVGQTINNKTYSYAGPTCAAVGKTQDTKYGNGAGSTQCCYATTAPTVSGGAPTAPAAPTTTNTTSTTELARPSVSGQGYTGGCNSVTLTWGAVPGATSYIIRQYNQAGVAESAFDKNYLATGTSYTVPGLISSPLTAYFFNIYATNGSTTSKASSILAATGACTTGQTPPTTCTKTSYSPALSTFCGQKTVTTNCGTSAETGTITCPANQTCTNNACVPSTTNAATFAFTTSLPGIASGGLGRNASPKKNSRTFSVALFAPNTQTKGLDGMIGTIQQANLVFNGSNNYTGQIQLAGVTPGSYFVKIKTDNSNWKLIPGVQTLTQGSTTTVPQVTLVTGDINNNNGLDVGDYSSMISCIKNTCDGNTKALADLNDDGLVDEMDLNILYSGFSNRNGD